MLGNAPITSLCSALSGGWRGGLDALFPRIHNMAVAEALAEGWHIDTAADYCGRCGCACGPGGATATGCSVCRLQRLPWDRVVRLSSYHPPMSDWIVQMKFHGRWRWGQWLGERLADRLPLSSPETPTLVCPVPMHWLRRWRRGFNQAQLMAQAIAQTRHWPSAPLLRRTHHRPPQTMFTASQRAGNVAGSIVPRPVDLTGYHIWLVDDVKTTGSTLRLCARLLRQQGAAQISIAVAAVAEGGGGGKSKVGKSLTG